MVCMLVSVHVFLNLGFLMHVSWLFLTHGPSCGVFYISMSGISPWPPVPWFAIKLCVCVFLSAACCFSSFMFRFLHQPCVLTAYAPYDVISVSCVGICLWDSLQLRRRLKLRIPRHNCKVKPQRCVAVLNLCVLL